MNELSHDRRLQPLGPGAHVQRLCAPPKQVATSKRGPKIDKPKGYVDGSVARSHVSTARVLKKARPASKTLQGMGLKAQSHTQS